MIINPPSAEAQLKFLDSIQRLLTEGTFVSTYKFALLNALADLSVEKEYALDGSLSITIEEIAEKFISYYWPQVIPYKSANPGISPEVLLQNSGKQGKIIQLLIDSQHKHSSKLVQIKTRKKPWKALLNSVGSVVVTMPLWKLQTVAEQEFIFLYDNTGGRVEQITLYPDVAWNFRHFHGLITNLIQSAWLLQIHRIKHNQPLLGKSSDLREFLFGSERANLDIYRPLLTDLQDKTCFYCKKPIKDKGEIDHFIPWSRYPVDLGHNFVLAHKGCNSSKSDYLADMNHLEHWMERNTLHEATLDKEFDQLAIEHDLASSKHIAYWAYEQTTSAGGFVWREKKILHLLDAGWRSLFH